MESKDRFPGLRSFEKEDAELFFGRDKEIKQLAKSLSINRINLLFGSSGVGKSSLLNTSFAKLAELKDFWPVRIRLNQNYTVTGDLKTGTAQKDILAAAEEEIISPLQIVMENLENHGITMNKDEIIFDRPAPKLWEYIKLADRNFRKANPFKTLVIIFDQFEEFFLFPGDIQTDFVKQLAEVCHELPPKRILDWIGELPDEDRNEDNLDWYKQPDIKILFAIRSDKLSLVNSLAANIPKILSNRLEIKPFNQQNARMAINGPAILPNKDGKYNSPPIHIDEDTITQIITNLSDKFNQIESSFLQIICYYIEQKVISGIDPAKLKFTEYFDFSNELFSKEIDISTILDKFYEEQITRIANDADRQKARRVIEDDLVIEHQRTSLLHDQLFAKLGKDLLIQYLVTARLIRTEETTRGLTYELSHDKLIEPIEKSRNRRIQKEILRQENYRKEKKLKEEALRKEKELEHQKELFTIETRLKKEAELARNIAVEAETSAVKAKVKAERRGLVARLFAVLSICCIIVICFLLRDTIRSNNNELINQADNYYNQNNHYQAFYVWSNYLDKPTLFADKKGSVDSILQKKFFFDIAGGDNLQQLGKNKFAVHHKDNTIFIWQVDTVLQQLSCSQFMESVNKSKSAINMLVSENKKYIAYRNNIDNLIYVYNTQNGKTQCILYSRLEPSGTQAYRSGIKGSYLTDYKMDFLRNNDFLAFIDAGGNLLLHNLKIDKKVPITVLKRKDKFNTSDLKNTCLVSGDNHSLIIKRQTSDTVKIWNLGNGQERIKKDSVLTGAEKIFQPDDKSYFLVMYKNRDLSLVSYQTKRSKLLLSDVTDMIVSPDGSKALLLQKNKNLIIYDFNLQSKIESKKLLSKFWTGSKIPKLTNIVSWIGTGNKFSFKNRRGIVFVIDLFNLSSYFICDAQKSQNTFATADGYNYIFSKDGSRGMYLDKKGVLKVVDIASSTVIYTAPVFKNSDAIFSLLYTLDNVIALSDDGKYVTLVKNFDANQNELQVVDLETKNIIYRSAETRYLGRIFTSKYIQAVFDYNTTGGIVLLNKKKRNVKYYKNLFPLHNQCGRIFNVEN